MTKFSTANYIKLLRCEFEHNANAKIALEQSAYMKNLFPFFGIKTPEQRTIVKTFLSKHGYPAYEYLEDVVKAGYRQKEREFHLFAIHLVSNHIKTEKDSVIPIIEYLVTNNSWWDSVDSVSSACIRPLFKLKPQTLDKQTLLWVKSGNMWLQRSSLICQLGYRDKTNEKVLFRNILALKNTNEFFLNKAIGWALREYSKTHPEKVKKFIKENTLSTLSSREASKYL